MISPRHKGEDRQIKLPHKPIDYFHKKKAV